MASQKRLFRLFIYFDSKKLNEEITTLGFKITL